MTSVYHCVTFTGKVGHKIIISPRRSHYTFYSIYISPDRYQKMTGKFQFSFNDALSLSIYASTQFHLHGPASKINFIFPSTILGQTIETNLLNTKVNTLIRLLPGSSLIRACTVCRSSIIALYYTASDDENKYAYNLGQLR